MCIKQGIKWWFVIFLSILLIIFGILAIIFFTPIIKFLIEFELNYIYNQPVEWWTKSSERLIKVYIYNVTNSNDFLMNKSKANLNELGPYIYEENLEYINVVKNPNGTISFNLNIYRNFRRDLSNSSENDIVVVPNTQMLRVLSPNNYEKSDPDRSLAEQFRVKPFEAISIKKLLWANDNPSTQEIENPGVFSTRTDITNDRITVFTGVTDSNKRGIIDQYNGKSKLTRWSTDNCNRLNGSFGAIFPKRKLTKDTKIDIFNNDLKRILPMYFKREITLPNGIRGYRYVMPDDFFENSNYMNDNECYCPIGQEACPESKNSGLFKISLTEESSHIIYSLPHFYLADPSLRNYFKGISTPQNKLHQMYADIHPKTGITLRYRAGLQINLVAAYGGGSRLNSSLSNKLPNIILPLVWFEESYENLPEEIINLTTLLKKILFGIIIALFIIAIILLICSIYVLIRSFRKHKTLQIQVNMNRKNKDRARTHVHVKRRER